MHARTVEPGLADPVARDFLRREDPVLATTTLDMVKRYVALAELDIIRRLHAVASPADRLLIGPKVSVILPRAVFRWLSEIGDRTRLTVEQLVAVAAERLAVSPPVLPALAAIRS